MNEIWKTISFNDKYSVSNLGKIRHERSGRTLLLKPRPSGYVKPCFGYGKKRRSISLHRLVAEHFLPNPDNKPTVNHKNGDKSDNRVDNLEWATYREQNLHRLKDKPKTGFSLNSARGMWRLDKNTGERLEYYQSGRLASDWVLSNGLTTAKTINNIKTKICAVARKKMCFQPMREYVHDNPRMGKRWVMVDGEIGREYQRKTAFGFRWEYDDNITPIEGEIWKDLTCIKNAKGYKISDYGRVINRTGRLANPVKHHSGYPWICVAGRARLIHTLVAKEFIPNPENKPMVNHLDGDKENYHVSNLEWSTNQENCQHAVNIGLHPELRPVHQLTLDDKVIATFSNCKEASRQTGISHTIIQAWCMGKTKGWRRPVAQMAEDGQILNIYQNVQEASDVIGCSYSGIHISQKIYGHCRQPKQTCGGYRWDYVGERFKWEYADGAI